MADIRKIWLVEFPTYQYKEDVKLLARQANLKVVDAKFGKTINPELVEVEKAPKLTKLPVKETK